MGCRAENRSSHRRSFRVRNDLPQWKNTDRPVIRSRLCNILAASSGRRGECEWPVTNQFEGTGDVLGLQLTRGIINTVLAAAKVAFAHEFPQQMKANTPLLVTFSSDPTFRKPVSRDLAQWSHEGTPRTRRIVGSTHIMSISSSIDRYITIGRSSLWTVKV